MCLENVEIFHEVISSEMFRNSFIVGLFGIYHNHQINRNFMVNHSP